MLKTTFAKKVQAPAQVSKFRTSLKVTFKHISHNVDVNFDVTRTIIITIGHFFVAHLRAKSYGIYIANTASCESPIYVPVRRSKLVSRRTICYKFDIWQIVDVHFHRPLALFAG
jgi:hypothetical protein